MLLKRAQEDQKNGIEGFAESEIARQPSNEFSRLCEAIDEMKTDLINLIKWMFILSVAWIVIFVGVLFAFFEH